MNPNHDIHVQLTRRVDMFPRGTIIGASKTLPPRVDRCVIAGNQLVMLVAEDRRHWYIRSLGRNGLCKQRWRWRALRKSWWSLYPVREFEWPQ
jgi:hypothetical protein